MKRYFRLTIKLSLLLVAVSFGIWFGYVPPFQTCYSYDEPLRVCPTDACLATYAVTIGNTGWDSQPQISIRLRDPAVQITSVAVAGVRKIPYQRSEQFLSFGPLEAGKWVSITARVTEMRDDPQAPEQIFSQISPRSGEIIPGHPNLLKFGRFLTFWASFL